MTALLSALARPATCLVPDAIVADYRAQHAASADLARLYAAEAHVPGYGPCVEARRSANRHLARCSEIVRLLADAGCLDVAEALARTAADLGERGNEGAGA